MVTKKAIIGNELMKEIISVRVDTMWKMLKLKKNGFLPGINEEGATGKYDNKGAIFVPGGLVYQDVDEQPIQYQRFGKITVDAFREKIRSAMRYDNATLLTPEGLAAGINLDSGFFSKAARRIYTFKKAAFRRKKKIGRKMPIEISSDEIIRSHCPTYIDPPYGARTRISTCLSVGLIDPPMYFAYCKSEFNFNRRQARRFSENMDMAQERLTDKNGRELYPPYVIVCHDTRYKENSYGGMTRILGVGKFGEFCTFSLEGVSKALIGELKRKKLEYADEDLFAEYNNIKILGILRMYSQTNPGKRSLQYSLRVVNPSKDVEIDIEKIAAEARERYSIAP